MRSLLAITALASSWGTALAHMPPESEGLAQQVGHQFFGLHHTPLVVFVIWLAVLGFNAARRHRAATCGRRNPHSRRKAG